MDAAAKCRKQSWHKITEHYSFHWNRNTVKWGMEVNNQESSMNDNDISQEIAWSI